MMVRKGRMVIGLGAAVVMAAGIAGAASASPYGNAPPGVASAVAVAATAPLIEQCILAAAGLHHLPPAVIVVLLNVEGGQLGRVSRNNNDTVDVGPMQVNQIWLPKLAAHWHASVEQSFLALRDNICANVEGGAWILREALDEAHGDFWQGVAIYHSHDPDYQHQYLGRVLHEVLRLEKADKASKPATQLARNDP
jgi:hypothetical protein